MVLRRPRLTADFGFGRLGYWRRSHLAPLRLEPTHFLAWMIYFWGFKMRVIHDLSLGERRVPYSRDHGRHFPNRGRAFHFDWNALKKSARSGQRTADARSRTPQA